MKNRPVPRHGLTLSQGLALSKKASCFALMIAFAAALTACASDAKPSSPEGQKKMFSNKLNASRSLIVIAAPSKALHYYAAKREAILDFDAAYAKAALGRENIIILADPETQKELESRDLPHDIFLNASMPDIWMRDFSPAFPRNPVQFHYTAAAQGGSQGDSDYVQKRFNAFAKKYNITFSKTSQLLDGGNVVDNNKDSLIVSERFLSDNNLGMEQARALLKNKTGVSHVAIIPSDDPDGLAHADGMVMFIENQTLAINHYDPKKFGAFFNEGVRHALKDGLQNLTIVEIGGTEGTKRAFDERFGSACGIYVNGVSAQNTLFVPTFNYPQADKTTLSTLSTNTTKEVVGIDVSRICNMGGSLRCLTWQLDPSQNAKNLILAARTYASKESDKNGE